MIDRQEEYMKMKATENKLWWYRILHSKVYKAFTNYGLAANAAILDAGCGTGGLMSFLKLRGYKKTKGIDLSETAVKICQEDGLHVRKGNINEVSGFFDKEEFDCVVSNDVLCYFEEDEQSAVLQGFQSILKVNGLLIMNLPSFKAFSGMHDIGVGIVHRFNKSDLRRFGKMKGFEIVSIQYWPFLLSPLIFSIRTFQRLKMKLKPDIEIVSDVSLPSPFVNALLLGICQFESLFSRLSPFGSSSFIILRKTSDEAA